MARAYEDDLRRKIFLAHANGRGSFRTLAAVFGVSLGYVEKIFRQRAQSGQMERVRHRPGPKSRVNDEVKLRMQELIAAQADLTVEELREQIAADTGVGMSWSLVRQWIGRLGLRLKKSRSTPANGTRKRTGGGARSSLKRSARSRRRG